MTNFTLPVRYKRTEEEASGGFGCVIKCLDTHLERFVAIKSISNPDDSPRMMDELSALMKLRSKHVVELYDVINCQGKGIAIVEEYVNGPSLSEIEDRILDSVDLIKILWQISSGISEIHFHDIIHRDIKPGNMKIDSEGVVKIYDFGLSRNVEEANTIGFKGTPIYAAPELFLHQVAFTKSIDTYAFAVTAMFLAKTPLPQEMSVLPKKLLSNPFDNSNIQLPTQLKELLFQCLNTNPCERPDMADVCQTLKKFVLYNSHRALLISDNTPPVIISSTNKSAAFNNSGVGSIEVKYSGSEFYISNLSGEVYVNNITAKRFNILPDSCVIILGASSRPRRERVFITFDLSHPEVVL